MSREDTPRARLKRKIARNRDFYRLQSILGCANWAMFYVLIGGR